MNVTTSSVSHWFKGDNFLDIDNLYILCQYLGVSIDQVFGLKPISVDIISTDEEEILSSYRKMSHDEKNMIRRMLKLPELKKDTSSKAE